VAATAGLTTDVLAPLAGLLAETHPGAYPSGLRLPGPPPAPWRPAADLTDPTGLDAVLGTVMAECGAERHVAGALLWKTYTHRAVPPVVLGWALNRRVPLATADATAVRPGPGDNRLSVALVDPPVAVLPGDPLAGAPGTVTLPDEHALLAVAGATLLGGHLAPALDTLAACTRLGHRPLWGSVAESVVHPLLVAAPALAPDPVAAVRRLLACFGRGLAALVDLAPTPGGTPYRRNTCCLAFTARHDFCATCCIPRVTGRPAPPGRG